MSFFANDTHAAPGFGGKPIVKGYVAAFMASLALYGSPIEVWAAAPDVGAEAVPLENTGKHLAAAAILDRLCSRYDQDYQLTMRAAWQYYKGERYTDAIRLYKRAVALSEGSAESRAGLKWSRHYLRRPRWRYWGSAGPRYYTYANHPVRKSALGIETLAGIAWTERVYLSAAYRYMHFYAPSAGSGSGQRSGSTTEQSESTFDHHELYALAAYEVQRYALGLHYGYVHDGSGTFSNVHAFAASARLSLWGHLLATTTLSLYDDYNPLQGVLGWRSPQFGPFVITPELFIQHADGGVFVSGQINATALWQRFSFWLGGKYGDQLRPANIADHIIYDIPERVRFGAHAGAQMRLGKIGKLGTWYGIDQLELAWQPIGMRRIVAQYVGAYITLHTGGI